MKRLSFITQFKIEFLLPFNGCRKVLRKMPEHIFCLFMHVHYILSLRTFKKASLTPVVTCYLNRRHIQKPFFPLSLPSQTEANHS